VPDRNFLHKSGGRRLRVGQEQESTLAHATTPLSASLAKGVQLTLATASIALLKAESTIPTREVLCVDAVFRSCSD
jgi:hypothetical protein